MKVEFVSPVPPPNVHIILTREEASALADELRVGKPRPLPDTNYELYCRLSDLLDVSL